MQDAFLPAPMPLMEQVHLHDGNLVRELIAAVVVGLIYLLSAPKPRKRLAFASLVLLGLAPVPLVLGFLFPEERTAGGYSLFGVRFFVLASLFHSLLLLAAVSVWERVAGPMQKIFLDVFRWLTVVFAFVVILLEAGVDPGGIFAGSAIISAAIGFASKDTLGNLFAGLAIHAENPFKLGDWIQYDDNPSHIGEVVEINWRATKVITLDLAYVIIPNGQLGQASIRNFTQPDRWSRRSLYLVTPYAVSPQRVQTIILEAIRGSFGVLDHPAPSVVTNAFTDRGVEHWVRLFTTEFDKRDRVDGMARDRIWFALARNGIEMPVATHAVRLTQLPTPALSPDDPVARRLSALERVEVLQPLGADRLRELATMVVDQVRAGGEQVVRQGEMSSTLYVIDTGAAEVRLRSGSGEETTLAKLGPGDFFGEMSLLTGQSCSATVVMLSEGRLLEIEKGMLQAFVDAEPQLAERFGGVLSRRQAERSAAVAATGGEENEEKAILAKILDFFGL
jgi:small-conductance mechanosensitive channel/CRP-like cAMP-binding protein